MLTEGAVTCWWECGIADFTSLAGSIAGDDAILYLFADFAAECDIAHFAADARAMQHEAADMANLAGGHWFGAGLG